MPRRSKHHLLTGHTRREPLVEIRYTGLAVVKASMEYKTNMIPILMHQMRISTNQVSSVVLRPRKLEIRKIVKTIKEPKKSNTVPWN
jgi:hypothetical protein